MSYIVLPGRGRRTVRYRLYVNQRLAVTADLTPEELADAQAKGEAGLVEGDRWIMIFEDLRGELAPWLYGNDDTFGPRIVRELFPGRKMPEGEMGWQKRNGVRVPPETGLHDINYGIGR